MKDATDSPSTEDTASPETSAETAPAAESPASVSSEPPRARDPEKLERKARQAALRRRKKALAEAETEEELKAAIARLGLAPAAAPQAPAQSTQNPPARSSEETAAPAPAALEPAAPAVEKPPAPSPAEFVEPCEKFWALVSKIALKADPLAKEEIEALGQVWAPIAAKYMPATLQSPWVAALATTSMILGPRVLKALEPAQPPAELGLAA